MTRPIFFLTDFGLTDTYVGVVKSVILGISPDARIVDLTHDVPQQDVRAGAFALLTSAPYLPDDAVVLAVVDPGVGTARRPIAVQQDGRTFVGPDNGLLSWAIGEGGGFSVVLDRPRFWRPTVSATFHGRDIFGPIAAHLASGIPLTELGSPCETFQTLPYPSVDRITEPAGRIVAVQGGVIHVDRFGNLVTSLRAADLPSEPVFEVAGWSIVGLALHFQPDNASAERPIALIGSAGLLEIAVPNGSAARLLDVGVGATVTVTRRDAAHSG